MLSDFFQLCELSLGPRACVTSTLSLGSTAKPQESLRMERKYNKLLIKNFNYIGKEIKA